jgi:uncharacterized membrane protein
MKAADIQKIQQAGLISDDQGRAIIEHFHLHREGNRFLFIVGIVGAVLVSAGVILLISSNWESIPRFVKLAFGLALLLGAHSAGWRLGQTGKHPVAAEILHLVGSGLFLANIALVGQIYNLSSRPPNAILLWLVGIAPMPWLLRSKAQHILTLCAFGLWLGLELNQRDSLLYFEGEGRQFVVYAMLGALFASGGLFLGRSSFPDFGPPTEKFGMLALHIASFPFTLGLFYGSPAVLPSAWVIVGMISVAAAGLALAAAARLRVIEDDQWRWVWAVALLGLLGLGWVGLLVKPERVWDMGHLVFGPHWIATPVLFLFCLVQAQVGLLRRAAWLVNLAIVFIGLHIMTAYFQLFGSMQTTGLMFLATGIFLIALAFYLERKRRSLLGRMSASATATSA